MQPPVVKEEKKIESQITDVIDESRVVGFSDAVFAFAATLLVLKIDIPDIARAHIDTQFPAIFSSLWPQYLANIISFLVIGYYWLNHHAIFSLVKRFDAGIVWLNLVFLVFVSFLPFPVDLYGDFFMVPSIVAFYSASLAIVGYMLTAIWWYASSRHRLVNPQMSTKHIRYYLIRSLIAPVVFTLAIPLVYIHLLLAQFSWLAVLVGIVLVNNLFHLNQVSKIEETSI